MDHSRNKQKAAIWDLDGTLSDDRARAHYVEVQRGKKRDWESYFDAMDADQPIAASIELLHALRDHGTRIIYLTGRPEFTRPKTEAWLKANGLDCHDELLMRPAEERRHAGDFKVDEIEKLSERYEIVCAFEDRIDVAEAIRASGTAVFLYGAGQQAAAEALEVLDVDQDELAGK